jgi:integrase
LRRARWAHLLDENQDFRRWYENLARGSEGTARERARILYRFLTIHDLTVDGLVAMAKADRRAVEDLLSDFMGRLHRERKAPGYMENYLKAVRSWLTYHDVRLVRRITIGNRHVTPSIADERVPTRNELRAILTYAGVRGKCSIALMAFAGLRPQVLGNLTGTDGLQLRDLPDVEIGKDTVTFTRIPTMVTVRPRLSKAGHKYFTFLPREGCEYLKAYLEKRVAEGEPLESTTPIIAVKSGYEDTGRRVGSRGSRHITTKSATKEIRDAMRPRFTWRPYVLRAYFDTQLLIAENSGKISHAYRQFFMGHQGDMEARYTTNKGRLPKALIESMWNAFSSCEAYLSTQPQSRDEDPELTTIRTMVESGVLDLAKPNVRTYLIQKLGIQDMEVRVAKLRVQGYDDDASVARTLYGELGIDPLRIDTLTKKKENGDPKKIVAEDELDSHLAEGWDVQMVLPSGKILIRK